MEVRQRREGYESPGDADDSSREFQELLAQERRDETSDQPQPLDIDELLDRPRALHFCEKLSYCFIVLTIILSVVNFSGPYLVYLKVAYGFHGDDLILPPAGPNMVDDREHVQGDNSHMLNHDRDKQSGVVKAMDSSRSSHHSANVLPFSLSCANIPDDRKFDCHPEKNPTKSACESRQCCWKAISTRTMATSDFDPHSSQVELDVPSCYYPSDYPGYSVDSVVNTDTGLRVRLSRQSPSYYPKDINNLRMDIIFETKQRLRIKIYDPMNQRYEVPLTTPQVSSKAQDLDYEVTVPTAGHRFGLVVLRKSTKTVLMNVTGAFMFSDQFIQLSYLLPSHYLYGLGEHRDTLLHSMEWTRFTMWNRDYEPQEGTNLYGSHPFYLMMEQDGLSHGMFLLNSNAMDVLLQPAPALTWRTIGGIIDLYVFLGPTPGGVVQQYTDVIGRPFMPPYWSLGFHQCRWGYKTVQQTLAVVDRLRQYGIPQDVQWNDIDYAVKMLDFTTDQENFGDQGAMVEELHSRGLHYVMMVDPAISNSQTPGSYPPYDVGLEMGVFVRNSTGHSLTGQLWPGSVVWPDFTNPRTLTYWTQMVRQFHKSVKFDGMWIDMNEPSNFVNGSIEGCPNPSTVEDPPYVPAVRGGSLRSSSLCATAQHYLGLHYNVHSLYGLTETNVSQQSLKDVRGKRPFVISRSTFPGQGHFGGHWTGDNNSTFYDMYKSISAILNMNMFGIPMVGADICGFRGNATAQLCRRWHQLGAFYPFARNHNNEGNLDQDPGAFGASVALSSQKALETRYLLLPYLYTLFHESHATGSSVARPLFFEFSEDKNTYNNDWQFLWGSALLISPVLKENQTTIEAYFPEGVWYDFHTSKQMRSSGQNITLSAPLDTINLHVRGGAVLPSQIPATTTTHSRKNAIWLWAYLDSNGKASGHLFWDDGDVIDSFEQGVYNLFTFTATSTSVVSVAEKAGYPTMPSLGAVVVSGLDKQPSKVELNGVEQQFTYDEKILTVRDLDANLLQRLTLQWR